MKKNFYVTTPIYYPSGNLHIGHAYTTVLADIIARYKKQVGCNVFFVTGSDEHGLKIEKKAKENNKQPQIYVDEIVKSFKKLWIDLDIDYDYFIRTTNKDHIHIVQNIFSQLLKKNEIKLGTYKGKYCISCEEFLTNEQIDENNNHIVCNNKPIFEEQESYIFEISKYKDFLNNLFKSNFLTPLSRKFEMLNSFVNNNLEDLSITRTNFSWGIKVLENPKHVIYVWIDALVNYISALKYGEKNSIINKFWSEESEVLQIVGKEITRFHSIYWPVLLKCLDLKMPDRLLSHGWILSQGQKMSKSLGNVISPIDLINKYGSDMIRFYISYNLPTDRDGIYSDELIIESININLANNIGNLISRVSNMIIKYFDGCLKKTNVYNKDFDLKIIECLDDYNLKMNNYDFSQAISSCLKLGNYANKLIEDEKPWELLKNKKIEEINSLLFILQKSISAIIWMLKPILVKNFNIMCEQMGVDKNELTLENIKSNNLNYKKIVDKLIIFKRIK